MRLRSNSFTSKLRTNAAIENQLNNLTIDVSHFKKKIIVIIYYPINSHSRKRMYN